MKRIDLKGLTEKELRHLSIRIHNLLRPYNIRREKYTEEQKQALVSRVRALMADGWSQKQACEEADVPMSTFFRWSRSTERETIIEAANNQ